MIGAAVMTGAMPEDAAPVREEVGLISDTVGVEKLEGPDGEGEDAVTRGAEEEIGVGAAPVITVIVVVPV